MGQIISPENGIKEFSKAEIQRTKEISDFVYDYLNCTGNWAEKYDEDVIEDDILTYTFPENSHFKQTTLSISKCHRVTVPGGKHVAGSTYYTIGDDGDIIDENYIGYKTRKDAMHAALIYISGKLRSIDYWANKKK